VAYLSTIITGTLDTVGKTFTHALGTTPDICIPVNETTATNYAGVITFDSQIFIIKGTTDGDPFRCLVQKLHSIIQ
jgi:hypothetical protein